MNLPPRVQVVAGAPHVEDLVVEPLVEVFVVDAQPWSVFGAHARVKADLDLPELPLDEATAAYIDLICVKAAHAGVWKEVYFLFRGVHFLKV